MKNGFAVESATRLKYQPRLTHFVKGIHGQSACSRLEWSKSFLFMLLSPCKVVLCCFTLLLLVSNTFAQTNYYAGDGTEYSVVGNLLGDQVYPDVALNSSGGFVVWQDNATDGSGWGISAQRLDGTLSGALNTFRVNVVGGDDQENARVTMLKNGGAAFVWQGGKQGLSQRIYARFLTSTNTWLSSTDILVSAVNKSFQTTPAIATLNNSNVVVVWGSYNQAASNSLQDVYGQIFSPKGVKVGTSFLVNQFIAFNQRSPVVASLKNGGFVVAWVSEQQRTAINSGAINQTNGTSNLAINSPSVDIYARLYNSSGTAADTEFLVSTDSIPHANPAIAVGSDGDFVIAWSGKDTVNTDNSWDIYARPFSAVGVGGTTVKVNSHVFGDQYVPEISVIGTDYLIAWTSLGQDASREGVYGQYLHGEGLLVGSEFRINGTTVSQQMHPVLASDGVSQFLTIWTSFTGNPYSFDLFAQRYANVNSLLQAMDAPFVHAPFVVTNNTYQPQFLVSWPMVQGIAISNYEVYVDGADSPSATVTNNQWTMTAADGLTTGSTHSFALDYVTTDGRRSPLSPSANGTTWNGCNYYGIPCEWMTLYYGNNLANWPAADADTDSDSMTISQEFQAGTIPTNAASALVVQLTQTDQGMFVNWNTQPGLTYQVQVTTDLVTWNNFGAARFAAGTSDSVFVGNSANSYYRVVLVW